MREGATCRYCGGRLDPLPITTTVMRAIADRSFPAVLWPVCSIGRCRSSVGIALNPGKE